MELPAQGASGESHYVEFPSAYTFAATLERLYEAIEAAGLQVFARIDHAAGAHTIGMTLPPAVVVIYGNPLAGTPLMQAAPQAALDLPLRILVREDCGQTFIAFHPAEQMLIQAGVPSKTAEKFGKAQDTLARSVAL